MDNQEKDELIKELDDLDYHLSLWNRHMDALRRTRFWLHTMWIMISIQLGMTIYDYTLPTYQGLFIPYTVCWILALLGEIIAKRDGLACLKEVQALKKQQVDEDYKLLTGEDRQ